MKNTIPPICVLDGDGGVREAVENLLPAEGFEVELFASAQRFATRAKMAPLSCVILDVELPGLSGLDLQRELSEAGLEIPIIFSHRAREHSDVGKGDEGRSNRISHQTLRGG